MEDSAVHAIGVVAPLSQAAKVTTEACDERAWAVNDLPSDDTPPAEHVPPTAADDKQSAARVAPASAVPPAVLVPPTVDVPPAVPTSSGAVALSPALVQGYKKTYYKRQLPDPPCTAFSSQEGRVVFQEALLAGSANGFFKLMEQFSTQDEPAFCGLATIAMVLNALSIDPRRVWKGVWRWFDESLLDCCKPLELVKQDGITFRQVACLARCNGAKVHVHQHGAFTEEEFRKQVQEVCCGSEEFIVLSYSRKALSQSGDGHFSPVGAYHAGRDLVLILDVARFKYPPHWVPLPLVYQAMSLTDRASGEPRGFLRMAAHPLLDSVLFTLDIRSDIWQDCDRFLRVSAPAEAAAMAAAGELTAEQMVGRLLDHVQLASLDAFLMVRAQVVTAAPQAVTAAPEVVTAAPELVTAAPDVVVAAMPEVVTAVPEAVTAALQAVTVAPDVMTTAAEVAEMPPIPMCSISNTGNMDVLTAGTCGSTPGTLATDGGSNSGCCSSVTGCMGSAPLANADDGSGGCCSSGSAFNKGTTCPSGDGGETNQLSPSAGVTGLDCCRPQGARTQLLIELRGLPLYQVVRGHLDTRLAAALPSPGQLTPHTPPTPSPPSPSQLPGLDYIVEKATMLLLLLQRRQPAVPLTWRERETQRAWSALTNMTGISIVEGEVRYLCEQLAHIDTVLKSGRLEASCALACSNSLDCAALGHV